MAKQFAVYKGLQKPLVYKGFKGKFIYWGIGCLLSGLVTGSVSMALINKYVGAIVMVVVIVGGLLYTATQQKKGLHRKIRYSGIFIHAVNLKKINQYAKKNRIYNAIYWR
ncbi:hypothetical protein ACVWYG_003745 [Pedobacter sp. UYEF25]